MQDKGPVLSKYTCDMGSDEVCGRNHPSKPWQPQLRPLLNQVRVIQVNEHRDKLFAMHFDSSKDMLEIFPHVRRSSDVPLNLPRASR